MFIRILNTVLVLIAVFMGLKQGWAMFTAKPAMLELFGKWGWGRTGIIINGAVTMLSALLILFPRTFVWGNFLMAAGILLIICFHLLNRDLKGAAIELPFLLLNLVIIYCRYPFSKIS